MKFNKAYIKKCLDSFPPKEARKIKKCLNYSRKYLSKIKRKDGKTYFRHILEETKALCETTKDKELICICLLHDILVHPRGKTLLKNSPLNKKEKAIIKKIHSLRKLRIDEKVKDLNHLIERFLEDPRLMLFRMLHRLNDIRNLKDFDKENAKILARETLYMYAPIAGRMSLHIWRHEMEDECFKKLHPKLFKRLKNYFMEEKRTDIICLNHTKKFLQNVLEKKGIKVKIDHRFKSLYSTYRKMVSKKRRFDQLTDRLALRVITKNVDDCYRILGVVHNLMHPIPGKLKDYIGAPKENGYKSIHTVVYPMPKISHKPIEIQIRTKEMHKECEFGAAAHFRYKNKNYAFNQPSARVDLFKNLEMIKLEQSDPGQFKKALTSYFSGSQLIIFDKNNNIFHFDKPSSALDFSLAIYKKRTKRIKTVFINGLEKNIDTLLNDGDVVDIKFGNSITFFPQWTKICFRKRSQKLIKELEKEIK